MFGSGIARIVVPVLFIAAAATGIVYATGSGPAKQLTGSEGPRAQAPADSTSLSVIATRKPVDYYSGAISSDLFGLPQPKPQPPAPKLTPSPPPKVEEPDPFTDYVYNGTVSIDGRQMALLENRKTKEGQYVSIGQPFLGGQVTAIDDRQVIVSLGTTNKTVAKTDDYKLVSLDKSAPFLNEGNQGGGQPGGPGGPPPGGPGGPGGPGMGMRGGPGRMRGGGMMFMGGGPGGPMQGSFKPMPLGGPAAAEAQAAEGAVLKLSAPVMIDK